MLIGFRGFGMVFMVGDLGGILRYFNGFRMILMYFKGFECFLKDLGYILMHFIVFSYM